MSITRPSKAETWRIYRRFVNDLQAVFLFAGTPLDNAIAQRFRESESGLGILCSTVAGEWVISLSSPRQETPRRWLHAWVYTRFDHPEQAGALGGIYDVNPHSGKWNHVLSDYGQSDSLIRGVQKLQPRVLRVELHPRFTRNVERDAARELNRV
jgi:hypothetical protein